MPDNKTNTPLVPKFQTEEEEANWWYENRQMVEDEFRKAIQDKTIRRGAAEQLVREDSESQNITIRIPDDEQNPDKPCMAN